jgi:hypothetical protein
MKPYAFLDEDIDAQFLLIVLNIVNVLIGVFMPAALLLLLLLMPITNLYHFFTNIKHISYNYPSNGFAKYRRGYFWLTLFYIPTAVALSFWVESFHGIGFPWFLLTTWIIIPQIVSIVYTVLCYMELKALTKNNTQVIA